MRPPHTITARRSRSVHFRQCRPENIYLVHRVGQDGETSEILVSKQVSFPFYF